MQQHIIVLGNNSMLSTLWQQFGKGTVLFQRLKALKHKSYLHSAARPKSHIPLYCDDSVNTFLVRVRLLEPKPCTLSEVAYLFSEFLIFS